MDLQTLANSAEDIAAGFLMLREPLPSYSTEITSLVAELYAISSSLRSLGELVGNYRYRRNLPSIQTDLQLVCSSLDYTLVDIIDFFDDIDALGGPQGDANGRIFREMTTFFRKEAHYSLVNRLRNYAAFSKELEDLMKDSALPNTVFMSQTRSAINDLLREQELLASPSSPHLGPIPNAGHPPGSVVVEQGSPVEHATQGRRGSYERVRPPHLIPSSSPSPTMFLDSPPFVPDAPDSIISSSESTVSLSLEDHWARKVFSIPQTTTIIPYEGERSKCLDRPVLDVKDWLEDEGFEELLQLGFEREFRVSFFVRNDDHRARIVCKARHFQGPSDYFCLALNLLEIFRLGSCLQICRRRHGGRQLVLWANLKFNTIEGMVLFFCTFLALRSQDSDYPVTNIRDYELDGEEELFGGKIDENGFLHGLRVYRDILSGAVRLQASVIRGDLKRVPVWTAFITPYIGSPNWMRRADAQNVYLRELNPVVFALSDYTPCVTPRGQFILSFTTPPDADDFVNNINDAAYITNNALMTLTSLK